MRRSRQAGPCMHEALFSDDGLAEGFSTLDIAKGLIDEGFHPMTVYFPLVVHGAMLVEPTETESKAGLDRFIGSLRSLAERAKAGDESAEERAALRAAAAARRNAGGAQAGAGVAGRRDGELGRCGRAVHGRPMPSRSVGWVAAGASRRASP